MNILLIFFALPIATIIIAIVLQKILKCPILVAAFVFAIYLIVTFVIGNLNFLVATIAYTIIAFITAFVTMLFDRLFREFDDRKCRRRDCDEREDRCRRRNNNGNNNGNNGVELLSITSNCSNGNDNNGCNCNCWNNTNDGNLLTISSNGCDGVENDLLTINTNCNNGTSVASNGNGNNGCNWNCCCNNNETSNNAVAARVNVIPNVNTNGRTGCLCGSYRRR